MVGGDADGMERGDRAQDQTHLDLREAGGLGDLAHVAHRRVAAHERVEEPGRDPARQHAALEGAGARVRDVEDQLVDDYLYDEPGAREKQLLVRIVSGSIPE